jgi:hypothetical protein
MSALLSALSTVHPDRTEAFCSQDGAVYEIRDFDIPQEF